jgi:hypothetical protein
MVDKPDGKLSRRALILWIVAALLVLYPLSTGPMVYVVAKLNGGDHTLRGPLGVLVLPWQPFYRALDYAPKPIFEAWEQYDAFFWKLATN